MKAAPEGKTVMSEKSKECLKLDMKALEQVAGGNSSEPEAIICPKCGLKMFKVTETIYQCYGCAIRKEVLQKINDGYDPEIFHPNVNPHEPHGPGQGSPSDFAPEKYWT